MKQMSEPSTPKPSMSGAPIRERVRPSPQFQRWTIEELRALARQLQIPGAALKSRQELLELFKAA